MSKETAKKGAPLCWDCKNGICVKQTSSELIPPMTMMANPEETPQEPWQKSEAEPKDPSKDLLEVSYTKFITVCYWAPTKAGAKCIPIQFDFVSECSRYEKNSG